MFEELFFENMFRLIVALLLGGVIGLEREYRLKDAGFRTHFLVAVGATLFTLISQHGFGDAVKDSSRVAAQIVSGIGFLGAGMIVLQKNAVRGLTTAAGLWVTAAIGMACGVGMYGYAVGTTLLMLLGLEVLHKWLPHAGSNVLQISFSAPTRESILRVTERMEQDGVEFISYEMRERRTSKGEIYEVNMGIKIKRGEKTNGFLEYLHDLDDIKMMSIE